MGAARAARSMGQKSGAQHRACAAGGGKSNAKQGAQEWREAAARSRDGKNGAKKRRAAWGQQDQRAAWERQERRAG